jgi:excisionase family DNA binding protein
MEEIMLNEDLLAGAIEAAAFVGVTPRAIYHMTEAGHLPVIRKGKRLYFRKSEIDAAFRSTPEQSPDPAQTLSN